MNNKIIGSSIRSTALSLAALALLANCSATKAIDATQSMPDKIDATNDQVKQTNAGMKTMIGEVGKTNNGMDTMIGEVKQTNTGMDTMIDQVKQTNVGMSKTNLGIHRQTLQGALTDILRDDNTRFLAPPIAMMPGAQIFTLEATPDELIQLIYVYLNFVEKTPANDQDTKTPDSFNHAKLVRLTAAQVLAGLAPQATIDSIVQAQINQAGPYQKAAMAMLMLRFSFIQQIIVQPKIDDGLDTPGVVADAVLYTEQLSAIADLPFAAQIGIKITGLLGPDAAAGPGDDGTVPELNARYTQALNPKLALVDWKKIRAAIDKLDPKYTDSKSDFAKQVADLKTKVLSHIPKDPAANNAQAANP